MLENGRITYKQLILLIFVSRMILAITYLPIWTFPPANQDVWIAVFVMYLIHFLLAIPIYLLWKRFPDKSIIQYSRIIAGKAGILIGILYIWFFIHLAAITLYQFGGFLTTAIMPETPILFFLISLMLFCAYAVHNGIEVMGRLCEIIAPIIMVAMATIFILLTKDMDFKLLTPVMEKGFLPVVYGGFLYTPRTDEIVGIAMILPYLNDRRKVKKVFIFSFSILLIFFLLLDITLLTTFGAQAAKSLSFPCFSMIRIISVGGFLERVESIHMGIWVLGIFIKVSFYYYLAVLGMSQLFKLKDYKPLVFPVGTIIVPLTFLIAESMVELKEFTSYKIYTWYAMFFILLIPLALLLIAIIRKKGAKKKCESAF